MFCKKIFQKTNLFLKIPFFVFFHNFQIEFKKFFENKENQQFFTVSEGFIIILNENFLNFKKNFLYYQLCNFLFLNLNY